MNKFKYSIEFNNGEIRNITVRNTHDYQINKFLLLKPIDEKSNILINLDDIKSFRWDIIE